MKLSELMLKNILQRCCSDLPYDEVFAELGDSLLR